MEIDEAAWRWIAGIGVVTVLIARQLIKGWNERRRRAWFGQLAATIGASAEHDSHRQSRAEAVVGTRVVEIAYRSEPVSNTRRVPGWMLVISTPLRAVSDIHNFRLQRRGSSVVIVETHGFVPREDWMTPSVRQALTPFFELADRADTLDVEGGQLRFRTPRRCDVETFQAILERQLVAAEAIERVL